jgi:hypothetical protein
MSKQVNTASRLESIVNMLIEFSRGNFEIQEEIGEDDDPLNTVIAGLNMVGEELAHYKRELGRNTEFLEISSAAWTKWCTQGLSSTIAPH